MLKKIDLYIIKKFLGTFFFAIALIILIVIIFDISEKIDDFLEHQAPLKEIVLNYYLNFIPYFINLFSPLFTFISVIFFTAKLAANTEIIAILSSGVSFRRLLRPYIIAASTIALLSFILTNFIIPPTNRNRLLFEDRYMRSQNSKRVNSLHAQIEPETFVYIDNYDGTTNMGFNFIYEKYSNGTLTHKIQSNVFQYDTATNIWKLQDYNERHINGMKESFKLGANKDTVFNLQPYELTQSAKIVEAMNFFKLNSHIDRETLRGSEEIPFLLVEKHKRIAFPFSTIILTIIGVSLSSRKVRGGIGLHIGAGIAISFTYIMFMQVSQTFATNGNLPAWIAVWIPNLIFGAFSIYLVRMAPK